MCPHISHVPSPNDPRHTAALFTWATEFQNPNVLERSLFRGTLDKNTCLTQGSVNESITVVWQRQWLETYYILECAKDH